MIQRILTLLTCLIFATLSAFAADPANPSFRIETSDGGTTPLVGQRFQLILSVSGDESMREPELPEIPGLKAVGSSSFTNVSIVNGKSTVTHEYAFSMLASKSGEFVVPALTLADNRGKNQRTSPFKFSVIANTDANSSKQAFPYTAVSMVNKVRAYVGEQIIYTVKLYYRTKVSDLTMQPPVHDGFHVQDLGDSDSSVENYQGNNYRVVTLRKALYATRPGKLRILPTLFDFKVWKGRGRRGNDLLFDDFFKDPFFGYGSSEAVNAASQEHIIEIMPLPDTGKPDDFSGLVGTLSVDLDVPSNSVARGSSVTVTTTLKGTALLRGDLAIDWQQSTPKQAERFKYYEDKPVISTELVGNNDINLRANNKKIFKSAIVPLQEGEMAVGPLRFNYFEPESKSYKIAESAVVRLQITPGELNESTVPVTSNETAPKMKVLGNDILPNHAGRLTVKQQAFKPQARLVLFVFSLPFMLLFAVAVIGRLLRKDADSESQTRRSRAAKRALKRLNNGDKSHAVFDDFLKERLNLPSGVITTDELHRALTQYQTDSVTLQSSTQMLQNLESVRLGLQQDNPQTRQLLSDLIAKLDQATRRAGRKQKVTFGNAMLLLSPLLLLLVFTTPLALADSRADVAGLSDKAEAAYSAGDFLAAKELYVAAIQRLAEQQQSNGHLFYNLGNCHFRLAEYSQALLQYRRAKLFLPRDRDLQANLEIVASRLQISDDYSSSTSALSKLFFWNQFLSLYELAWCFLWVQLLLSLLWIMRRRLPQNISVPLLSSVAATYLLVSLSLAGMVYDVRLERALVTADGVKARSGKGDDFITILQLTVGSEVEVLEKDGDWWKIAVADVNNRREKIKGFVPAQQLNEIGAWKLLTGAPSSLFSMNSAASPIDRATTGTVQ